MIAKHRHDATGVADIRKAIATNVTTIDFAARLWQVFRALITGALENLNHLLGDVVATIRATIERHVQAFFVQALQLDPRTLLLEAL